MNRRKFTSLLSLAAAGTVLGEKPPAGSRQASGVKVGEATDSTARVWVRITRRATPNADGAVFDRDGEKKGASAPEGADPEIFKWAAPGAAGKARVRYGTTDDLANARETEWIELGEATDFSHQFPLTELKPGARYFYATETAPLDGGEPHAPVRGEFRTAPAADDPAPVTFALLNCQLFAHRQSPEGFDMYPAALALEPDFVGFTGDVVYYDRDSPCAHTPALARYHWQRMYGMARHAELLRTVGSYWMKDDHDTFVDDSWPGKKSKRLKALTFEDGQRIFREQTPMGESGYRTFRWGRDMQVWFIEGRDFRTPNKEPDGPEKTILGTEQKRWLKETLAASEATWRVLISPTPWVGPDRGGGKSDNHANANFHHEQVEMLTWFRDTLGENFVILCGDRHWQYESVHPEFGVREFSIGPCADAHAQHPEENPEYHRFFRDKGGFLSASAMRSGDQAALAIRLHGVGGEVVHEWTKSRAV